MKALRTAAIVVGAVALAATGIGAAASASLIGGTLASGSLRFAGIAASTFTTIGTIAGVTAAALSAVAGPGQPKTSLGGNPVRFKIDRDAGYPYAIGRTYSGGNVVHRQYYGPKNAHESWVTVHSLGPIKALGPLEVDKTAQTFSGGAATGSYAGFMWLDEQLGACPEPAAMAGPFGDFPGWAAADNPKLSGLAAELWTLKWDKEGKVYPTGVPQRGRVIEGVYVYDPREDSTYPGGIGDCRIDDPSSYIWSENPALHALTWAYGRYQNGMLMAGGGTAISGIDVAAFVDWANTCEVNDWRAGGIVYTSTDDSWDVLRMIAQAGGGEVMPVGALLSCTFSAPRVSIGLITSNDIIGTVDVPFSASRRKRRNTIIPRVRLESHGWEVVPLDAIEIPEFVAADGGRRPREMPFPLVQSTGQAAELGLYELWNARELDPLVLPCKVYAVGYRPGDCLTVNIPEAALIGRDVIVRERELDGATFGVTLTCRGETAAKHEAILGTPGTPPPVPDLSVPPIYTTDPAGEKLLIANSHALGMIPLAEDATTSATITVPSGSRVYLDRTVAVSGGIITGLAHTTTFWVYYDDADRAGGAVALQATTVAADAYLSDAHPARHFVGFVTTPDVGGGSSSGGGVAPPGSLPPP